MGELHLEIIIDRMLREFKVQANVGKPQVAYKETITKRVESEYKYEKEIGGKNQYGHVIIELEPVRPGSGLIFENRLGDNESLSTWPHLVLGKAPSHPPIDRAWQKRSTGGGCHPC